MIFGWFLIRSDPFHEMDPDSKMKRIWNRNTGSNNIYKCLILDF